MTSGKKLILTNDILFMLSGNCYNVVTINLTKEIIFT